MIRDFRDFIARGNVVDMAVGIIVGAAFGGVVTSLVNDVVMPPIGLVVGGVDFSNLFVALDWKHYPSLAAAKAAGAPTVNYGVFVNTVVNFLIIAFAIFLLVRAVNRLRGPAPVAAPNTRECPYCASVIPVKAVRCGHCTSDLRAA